MYSLMKFYLIVRVICVLLSTGSSRKIKKICDVYLIAVITCGDENRIVICATW